MLELKKVTHFGISPEFFIANLEMLFIVPSLRTDKEAPHVETARPSVRSSWTNMQKGFTKSCKQAWGSLKVALWQLQLIPAGNLYTCVPIWAKFCTGQAYESPLRNCELREDGLSNNYCLIKDVQELEAVFSTFFVQC